MNLINLLTFICHKAADNGNQQGCGHGRPRPQHKTGSPIMVDYIGIESIQKIVRQRGAAAFIEGLAGEIEHDYRRWNDFDKSARHAIHSPDGVIELMPTSDGHQYSFKYVNGHPKNTELGLLTVTAFGVLADVDTGYPLLLSELTITTALRTAATSALAAKWMARPGQPRHGHHRQRRAKRVPGDCLSPHAGHTRMRLFDIDAAASDKLARNLHAMGLPGLRVVICPSAAEAVQGADIVTTITADKRNAVILTPEMIHPGMHLNAVGGDCPGKTELHADILLRKDARVVVEFEPQSRIEGEIQQMPEDFKVAEFADVLKGTAGGALRPKRSRFSTRSVLRWKTIRPCATCTSCSWPTPPTAARSTWCRAWTTPRTCSACWHRPQPVQSSHPAWTPPLKWPVDDHPVDLIGAPTDIGAGSRGASMGPEALRVAGIREALQARGLDVPTPATWPARPTPGCRRPTATGTWRKWSTGTRRCTKPCTRAWRPAACPSCWAATTAWA
jgi:ornithine cyclodeaminase